MPHEQRTMSGSPPGLVLPIHRDGYKFLFLGLAGTILLYWLWPRLAVLALVFTLWIAFFFRDPDRVAPQRAGLVVSPADGRIVAIADVEPPVEIGIGDARRTRLSIHLSPLDVHVNRAPVSGQVTRSVYVPGAFLNPTLDKASEQNERRALVITEPGGAELAVVQIAGIIARRIVTYAGEGDLLGAGQRFGLIRFGSRVDVYLPPGRAALACLGQRAIAGETVLADIASDEPARVGRRE